MLKISISLRPIYPTQKLRRKFVVCSNCGTEDWFYNITDSMFNKCPKCEKSYRNITRTIKSVKGRKHYYFTGEI